MRKKISLVFFGSGPVAAKSLRLLLNTFDIEAVITKPATEQDMSSVCPNVPVLTVRNRLELDNLIKSADFSSVVAVLIDFGIIVSQKVIDYFPKGIINSHFSLLPELRGPDPISFAILEGKKETGVSLMMLVEAMDEGPLLAQTMYTIKPDETTRSLTNELIDISASTLATVLPMWLSNDIQCADQETVTIAKGKKPSYTRKLTKSDGIIDWSKPGSQIEREIRAFVDWPKSQTILGSVECIILEAKVIDRHGESGKLLIENKCLIVYCGDKALQIIKLKPAGKKEMTAEAFLAGYSQRLTS